MDPSIRKLSLSALLHIIVPAKREGMLAPLVMLTVCIYRFRPHSRSSSRRAAVLSVPPQQLRVGTVREVVMRYARCGSDVFFVLLHLQ